MGQSVTVACLAHRAALLTWTIEPERTAVAIKNANWKFLNTRPISQVTTGRAFIAARKRTIVRARPSRRARPSTRPNLALPAFDRPRDDVQAFPERFYGSAPG